MTDDDPSQSVLSAKPTGTGLIVGDEPGEGGYSGGAHRKTERVSWWDLVFRRMTDELVLVGILKRVREDGTEVPRDEIWEDMRASIEAERLMIRRHGRKMAAQLYGAVQGVRSSMQTVDFILTYDFEKWYRELGPP